MGGAEVMRFVRTLISRFGWMIVIFMLKGATSKARLYDHHVPVSIRSSSLV